MSCFFIFKNPGFGTIRAEAGLSLTISLLGSELLGVLHFARFQSFLTGRGDTERPNQTILILTVENLDEATLL
jgi:hypothetical protein